MNKGTWILWAVILMIPGAVGLGYHLAQKRGLQEQIAAAAAGVAETSTTDEYLQMYEDWYRLSAEEKAENPWGQDPYGGPEIQQRLKDGQSARLLADMPNLEKGIQNFPDELAVALYGYNWRQTVEDYRRQRSKADKMLIGSVFLLGAGGVLLVGGLMKVAIGFGLSRLKRSDADPAEEPVAEKTPTEQTAAGQPELDGGEYTSIREARPVSDMEKVIAANRKDKDADADTDLDADDDEPLGYFEARKKASPRPAPSAASGKGSLSELSKSLSAPVSVMDKSTDDSYFGWALREDEGPEMQTLMTPEPLTKELTELTEEVSAIRAFAAQQQDQVRKLQDGYDWMITRRFCMRIIRSIDNIEDRIGRLDDPDSEIAKCLEDIHDELVFALESSGIEQFNPDLEIPYKGLEKYAEAVRGRVPTDDESRCGCIAEIVRPGYQYLISDDDVKIVRCAQVKLYETSSN